MALANGQARRVLQERSPARVILETCTEAFRIAALAQRAGHVVRVVAATLVRSLGVGTADEKRCP
jgi:hypothetical protein